MITTIALVVGNVTVYTVCTKVPAVYLKVMWTLSFTLRMITCTQLESCLFTIKYNTLLTKKLLSILQVHNCMVTIQNNTKAPLYDCV